MAALANFYKALALFAIIQIISELGIPAQYQRMRKNSTDEKLFERNLKDILISSGSITVICILSAFFLNFYIENILLTIVGVMLIIPRSISSLINSFLLKRHRHREILRLNTLSSAMSLIFWLSATILSMLNFIIDETIAVATFLALPIAIRFYLSIRVIYYELPVRIRIERITFKQHRKIHQIRLLDTVKGLLGLVNNQLLIIFASILMNDDDVALMGILVTWGNRVILIFISTLKQVTYSKLVHLGKHGSSFYELAIKNYFLNVTYSLFLLIGSLFIVYTETLSVDILITKYLLFSSLIYCSTPFIDLLKVRGVFGIILIVNLIKFNTMLILNGIIIYGLELVTLSNYINFLLIFAVTSHVIDLGVNSYIYKRNKRTG